LVEEKWAEALVGATYSPTEWLSLGLSAGVEVKSSIYRIAGSAWAGKGKTSLLFLWEKGDGVDNYWYKTILSYKISGEFDVNATAWRFHGVGPSIRYTPKKKAVTIWLMPAYDIEFKAKRIMLGVSVKI